MLMPPPDGYEDGTQNFLSIAQLHFGFKQLEQLGGIQVNLGSCCDGVGLGWRVRCQQQLQTKLSA